MTLTLRAISLNEQPLSQPITACFDDSGGTIGRADHNTLALPDPERHISRLQAEVSAVGSAYVIKNLGAANPIVVSGRPLVQGESVTLSSRDQVRIGGYLLEVVNSADDLSAHQITRGRAAVDAHTQAGGWPASAARATTGGRGAGASGSIGMGGLGSPLSSSNPFADLLGNPTPLDEPVPMTPAAARAQTPRDTEPAWVQPVRAEPVAAQPPARVPNAIDELFGLQAPGEWAGATAAGDTPVAPAPASAAALQQSADPFAALFAPASPAGSAARVEPPLAPATGLVSPAMPAAPGGAAAAAEALQAFLRNGPAAAPAAVVPVPVAAPLAAPAAAVPVQAVPALLDAMPTPSAAALAAAARAQPPVMVAPAPPPAMAPAVPAAAARADAGAAVAAAAPVAPGEGAASADMQALWQAFCEGAGVDVRLPQALSPELMRVVGTLLHSAVEGTLQLMAVRAAAKHELRAAVTVIQARSNNPLKFSPDARSALEQLLQPPMRGFLPGPAAMTDAMHDLVGHSIGTMAGMRAALEGMLGRFTPEELERKLAERSVLDTVLPINRKAKLWDLYLQHFDTIRGEAQEDFHTLFGKAFLAAYEQQLDRLKSSNKSGQP